MVSSPDNRTKRVLIVDDTTEIRHLLGLILKNEGFEVKTASNGMEAKELLSENKYDILLVDMGMPIMDGREFFRHLEVQWPDLTKRVIFMSSDYSEAEKSRHLLNKTQQPFLPMPFDINELISLIEKCTHEQNLS